MRFIVLALPALLLFCSLAFGQSDPAKKPIDYQNDYQLPITRTNGVIVLDGELNEEAWTTAAVATDFWLKFPRDDQQAPKSGQTEVRLTYDDKNLYVSAICYDTSYYVVQTLKRDVRYYDGDGFAILIDPVNKKTNGFFFGVSPFNVQSEDLVGGTVGNLNFSWDNKWFSEVKRYEDRWVVEMAIPFKTLRFDAGVSR